MYYLHKFDSMPLSIHKPTHASQPELNIHFHKLEDMKVGEAKCQYLKLGMCWSTLISTQLDIMAQGLESENIQDRWIQNKILLNKTILQQNKEVDLCIMAYKNYMAQQCNNSTWFMDTEKISESISQQACPIKGLTECAHWQWFIQIHTCSGTFNPSRI